MRLKKGLLARESDGQITLVSHRKNFRFNGTVTGNETTAFIIKCLKHRTSEKTILRKMSRKYDASQEEMLADIREIIDGLRKLGLIDE